MTPDVLAKVCAYWLPACIHCKGTGERRSKIGEDEHTIVVLDTDCGRCRGIGYTLQDATRENWPFNQRIQMEYPERFWESPRFPDFDDPRDAAVLARRIHAVVRWDPEAVRVIAWDDRVLGRCEIPHGREHERHWKTPQGPTLGAALLAAVASK